MANSRQRSGSRRSRSRSGGRGRTSNKNNNNNYRVHYREPKKWFIPMVIGMALLTYLVISTEVSHSGKARLLPKWAATPRTGLAKLFFYFPSLFEKLVVNTSFRVGHFIFGGLPGLRAIFILAWGIHFIDLVIGVFLLIKYRATGPTMAKYIAGIIAGGCSQLWPLMEACKRVRGGNNRRGGRSRSRSRSQSRSRSPRRKIS